MPRIRIASENAKFWALYNEAWTIGQLKDHLVKLAGLPVDSSAIHLELEGFALLDAVSCAVLSPVCTVCSLYGQS